MILAGIFACFCLASAVNYLRTRRQRQLVANLKGPFSWPLLGAMHKIVLLTQKNFFQHSARYLSKYGTLSRCWIFHRLFIPVADLELARQLLESDTQHQATGYELMQDWLGGSVTTCKPEQWQQRHELLAGFFKPENIPELKKLLEQQAEQLQPGLQEQAEARRVCDAWQLVSSQVLETMLRITCGGQPRKEYIEAFADLTELYRQRFLGLTSANRFTFWLGSPLMRRRQRKLIKQINEENKMLLQQWRSAQQTKEDSSKGLNVGIQVDQLEPMQPTLLQLLLATESLTDAEICAELNNCNYLGYLLCSSTLCFALVHIARHPSVQQRCLEELRAAPAGELPYLQAVLQETLRLHPPQLIVGRQLAQDFPYTHSVVGDAASLPAGAEIYINLYELQRSEQHYGSLAAQFDPERFLANPPELLSFGLGPRSCPARRFALQLLESLLGSILTRYELLPYGDALRPNLRLAPASCNGFQLALKPR